eukprot:1901068-Amphidinium_carterae.2
MRGLAFSVKQVDTWRKALWLEQADALFGPCIGCRTKIGCHACKQVASSSKLSRCPLKSHGALT